jgi:signal transduction histidine kinase
MIQAIYRNAVRLQKLTNDILDVTRIESRSLKLNKEQFNLNDLISTVVEDYKNHIQKENDNVKLFYDSKNDVGGVVALVEADKGRITQVISNLLSNAIKFTKYEGVGDIYVNAYAKDNNQVIVNVKDTGTGIDPEIMPKLFTKFATKSDTGTGLGLFISKSIIEAHGGKIWAENNNDDRRGATFHFSLPLKQ